MLQYYSAVVPRPTDRIVLSWDIALSEKEAADYSACVVLLNRGDLYFVIEVIRGKFPFDRLKEKIIEVKERYGRAASLVIEEGGISYGLIQALREKHVNIVDYKPRGDKQERLIAQIDLFEGGWTPGVRSVTAVVVAPTREEITTAYQSALQGGAPRAAAVAEPMIPGDAIHRLDPSEIASSLRRGDDLIASGDLAAARLVLRRAADAGDARAAMTLAETYDPVILEKLGVHGFVPDVAMARVWYEKAKQFGSAEAPQRLELLATKQH